jgi:hypothetical protein
MADISFVVPIAEIFEVTTDTLFGLSEENFDIREIQRQDAIDGFYNSIRSLILLDTIEACDAVQKIINIIYVENCGELFFACFLLKNKEKQL